ncbi:MAG: ABC transporter ATP-binding protein [Akkermansia sp.]
MSDKLFIDGVSKSFPSSGGLHRALEGVSLRVQEGEFVCLIGPSGCGKTTLLNMLACLLRPDEGTICQNGIPIVRPGRERAMVFQELALLPWLDVLGNVLFGMRKFPFSREERRRRAEQALEKVGLGGYLRARIHELSGGMRQRVAIARALAPRPEVLLLDEPFSALDALTREQLYADVQRLHRDNGTTIVMVSHNVREAICLADRLVLLSPSPGRIIREYPVQLPRPRGLNCPELARLAQTVTEDLRLASLIPQL